MGNCYWTFGISRERWYQRTSGRPLSLVLQHHWYPRLVPYPIHAQVSSEHGKEPWKGNPYLAWIPNPLHLHHFWYCSSPPPRTFFPLHARLQGVHGIGIAHYRRSYPLHHLHHLQVLQGRT